MNIMHDIMTYILIKILKYMPAYSHLRNEEHEKVKYKRGKGIE